MLLIMVIDLQYDITAVLSAGEILTIEVSCDRSKL